MKLVATVIATATLAVRVATESNASQRYGARWLAPPGERILEMSATIKDLNLRYKTGEPASYVMGARVYTDDRDYGLQTLLTVRDKGLKWISGTETAYNSPEEDLVYHERHPIVLDDDFEFSLREEASGWSSQMVEDVQDRHLRTLVESIPNRDGPNMTIAEITIDKSNHDPNLDSLIFSNVSITYTGNDQSFCRMHPLGNLTMLSFSSSSNSNARKSKSGSMECFYEHLVLSKIDLDSSPSSNPSDALSTPSDQRQKPLQLTKPVPFTEPGRSNVIPVDLGKAARDSETRTFSRYPSRRNMYLGALGRAALVNF